MQNLTNECHGDEHLDESIADDWDKVVEMFDDLTPSQCKAIVQHEMDRHPDRWDSYEWLLNGVKTTLMDVVDCDSIMDNFLGVGNRHAMAELEERWAEFAIRNAAYDIVTSMASDHTPNDIACFIEDVTLPAFLRRQAQ